MKRITKLCRAFAFALFAWIVALQLPVSHTMLLLLGPLLLLVAFGLYLLMLLVAGAVSFRSCPEDAKALQEDICRAREDLKAHGFQFHSG